LQGKPRWISTTRVIKINREVVAETGEPYHLRDRGLLESACARPANHWAYGGKDDIITLATALLFGIARNHPFEQGNKRTGFLAASLFLRFNGYKLSSDEEHTEVFGKAIEDVIEDRMTEEDFIERIRPFVVPD